MDCTDDIRRERLIERPGWTTAMVEEALNDAHILRQTVRDKIDTGLLAPDEVAERIHDWLNQSRQRH